MGSLIFPVKWGAIRSYQEFSNHILVLIVFFNRFLFFSIDCHCWWGSLWGSSGGSAMVFCLRSWYWWASIRLDTFSSSQWVGADHDWDLHIQILYEICREFQGSSMYWQMSAVNIRDNMFRHYHILWLCTVLSFGMFWPCWNTSINRMFQTWELKYTFWPTWYSCIAYIYIYACAHVFPDRSRAYVST